MCKGCDAMKIEKVNSNQIRCTLSKVDLVNREIKISELAYGTDKAQELFKDMMEQASNEFGFEAENVPLMIEAVPLSTDSIMLIITKVDKPEEFEDKFSALASSNVRKFKKHEQKEKKDSKPSQKSFNIKSKVAVFSFQSLDDVTSSATQVKTLFNGYNTLYKDEKNKKYYLVLHNTLENDTPFVSIINVLSEYGDRVHSSDLVESFYQEHYETIVRDKALQVLGHL